MVVYSLDTDLFGRIRNQNVWTGFEKQYIFNLAIKY